MAFVSDTFTDSDGTALTSHTGGTGATWTRHSSYSAFTAPKIKSNACYSNDAGDNNVVCYASGTPAGADYTVEADFISTGSAMGLGIGIAGRVATGADTFYCVRYAPSTTEWQLLKRSAGSFSAPTGGQSQVYSDATFNGSALTRHIKLEMIGTAIKVYIDGTQRISVTDTTISSAGRAGTFSQGHDDGTRPVIDSFTATDYAAAPGVGTIGTATIDRFARVTLPFTAGSGTTTSLVVSRSNDNSTFYDVTSTYCDVTDNGGGSWTVIDRRPHYGDGSTTYNGTIYYKIAGASSGGTGTASSVKTVSSVDVNITTCVSNRAATLSTLMGGARVAISADEAYPGYWMTAMAYAYKALGTAQYKTDCMNQFAYIRDSLTHASGIIQIFGDSYLNRDSHGRTLAHALTAARLLRAAGATTDATTITTQCDVWAKAYFNNLNAGDPAPSATILTWDPNDTTGHNAQQVWQGTHAYTLGEVRRPTSGNNHTYRVTTAGTSSSSQPTWPTTPGATVTDGSVVWTETTTTASLSHTSYSTSGPSYLGLGQYTDLNQNAEEALWCALIMDDTASDFHVAGTYRTKATTLMTASVNVILAHETSSGAIPIGTAGIGTPTTVSEKRWYDTLYGNYCLQQLSAVAALQPTLNPYLAGYISRGLDYSIANHYGTETTWTRRRYSTAEPGIQNTAAFYDLIYLDAACAISSKTNPQSHAVWTTCYQNASTDKVSGAAAVHDGTPGTSWPNDAQAEMLDGLAFAAAFFPTIQYTVDAIVGTIPTSTKTYTTDAVVLQTKTKTYTTDATVVASTGTATTTYTVDAVLLSLATTEDESFVLNGTELNDGVIFAIDKAGIDMSPPKKRMEWVDGADVDGSILLRDPLWDNREIVIPIRIRQQSTMNDALTRIAQISDLLEESERNEGGIPLVWTPKGASNSMTFYVLSGEITDMPISIESGWRHRTPIITVRLTCKPHGYGDEVTWGPTTSTSPTITHLVTGVAGDAPAEGRLIVTDGASQPRRHFEWGLRESDPATAGLIDSVSLVTSGFAGSATTRTGAYSSSGVIRATLTTSPVAVCGLGNLAHVGTYRIKARIYPVITTTTATDLKVRLSWREGDGPLRANDWTYPVAGTAAFSEVDLGTITVPEATLGTQRWTGQIEAYSSTAGDTIDVDFVDPIPTSWGYGKARAPFVFETVTTFSARDEFNQAAGNLNGKTAAVGGAWATSGATTDLAVEATGHTLTRSTTSDAAPGRMAVVGSGVTNSLVQVDHKATAYQGSMAFGVVARYVDDNNFVRAYSSAGSYFVVTKCVAGVFTVLGLRSFTPAASDWYSVRLVVFASGQWAAWMFSKGGAAGNPLCGGTDADLATGGALASGKPGINDQNSGVDASTRSYDNWFSGVPVADAVTFSGQSAEIRYDSAIREDSTGTYYGPIASYRGARFFLQPSGSGGLTNEITVKLRRNDIDVAADDAIADSTTVSGSYRSRFVVVPR